MPAPTPTELHEGGLALARNGQFQQAAELFERACSLLPGNPVWHFNRGLAWQQAHDCRKAVAAYLEALALQPKFFAAWQNLCIAYKSCGQFPQAIEAGRRALEIAPRSSTACLALGNAFKAHGDLQQALEIYQSGITAHPPNRELKLSLANTYRELAQLDQAFSLFVEILRAYPDWPEAHRDHAFALLLAGKLPEGWVENEWRWQTPEMKNLRRYVDRAWQGQPLSGTTLLIHVEQGAGDALQFLRYVNLAADQAAKVVVECTPPLLPLVKTMPKVSHVFLRGEEPPQWDYHLPLLSAPLLFGTRLDNIPAEVPYFFVPAMNHPKPRASLPNVGFVWAGNPAHANDLNRSIPYESACNFSGSGVANFFSLQKGRAEKLPEPVYDLSAELDNYYDTARVIAGLDLIVSVDTSVAHLAGALGKPAWLLLPFAPDWRWLLQRNDSPWYPTMRIYRQPKPGDWASVLTQVQGDLAAYATPPRD